jgi:phospholipid/cholesterol/gamma-HCH transport system substrate-binding protein
MNERALRFRIGVFVLAALLLLAVLITLFGSFPTLFRRFNHYFVRFADAPGVAPGTPVRRSGVRVGEVKEVHLDNDTGEVRVELLVEKQYVLRRSDQPTLVHGLLGGDTAIDFVPRKPNGAPPDRTPLEPGEELTGVRQASVNTLLNQTSDMIPVTQETLTELRRSLQRFDRMAPLMEDTMRELRDLAKATNETVPQLRRTNDEVQVMVRNWSRVGERFNVLLQTNEDKLVKALDNLNDTLQRIGRTFSDENQRNLTDTLKNVRAGTQNLESLSRNTDELIKESQKTVKRVNESLGKADNVLANLQEATRPMAERSASVMKNLDESVGRLNKVLIEVQGLLRTIDQADGSLRKFLIDPSLYNHLDEAACAVTSILPRVDRVMRDLEVFADKLARHPESLGLGGVLRPSSGLKDPPLFNPPAWMRTPGP